MQSRPPGARVYVNDRLAGSTPVAIPNVPAGGVTVRIELDGYEPRYGFLDRTASAATLWNILLGGLIGLVVDYSNDSVYTLTPDPLHVTLEESAQ